MATWKKFEEIKAWQKAREVARRVYELTRTPAMSKDFAIKDQMRRSSGSVMDNIAEGFCRGGNREFVHFLSISKGSNGELQSQLYRALDQQYIDREAFSGLYSETEEVGAMLTGLMAHLQRSSWRGNKFRSILMMILMGEMMGITPVVC